MNSITEIFQVSETQVREEGILTSYLGPSQYLLTSMLTRHSTSTSVRNIKNLINKRIKFNLNRISIGPLLGLLV
jgi:hypothetical protein